MSFILEALKKLEQKRQHGAVPDLLTVHAPEQKETRKRPLWIYLLFGALIINAGILTAVLNPWGSDKSAVVPKSSTDEEVQTAGAEQNRKKIVLGEALPYASLPQDSEIHQPFAEVTTHETETAAQALLSDEGPVHETSHDIEIKNGQEEETDTLQNEAARDLRSPMASLRLNPSKEELDNLRSKIKEERASTVEESEGAMTIPAEDKEVKSNDTILELSELSAEIKDDIPDISISSHIYSNDPSSRLASINGSILREGENVKKGLKVDEITVSGVVFSYQGVRFRVRAF